MARAGLLCFALVALAAGIPFAGCAEAYYDTVCGQCGFDSEGTMDFHCQVQKEDVLSTCWDAAHPMGMALYHEGECPQIADCRDTMRLCVNSVSSGNDSRDCETNSLRSCYASADACVASAAADCGMQRGEPATCEFLPFFVIVTFGAGILLARKA